MDPDFGTAAYNPGNMFAFPRSYIKDLVVDVITGAPFYAAGLITILYPTPDPVTQLIVLRDWIHPWSSNSYTLGGVVASAGYFFASDPSTFIPAHVSVTFLTPGTPPRPAIVITPHLQGGLFNHFLLPEADGSYWLQH